MGFGIRMTLAEFSGLASIDRIASLSPLLRAMWHDARGDWTAAHETAQELKDAVGSWIHAYLHRKEGDFGNAAYWYDRAGKPEYRAPFEDEWNEIATALIKRGLG